MRPVLIASLLALALTTSVVGCRTVSRGPSYPADPLFAIKKPQIARAPDAAPAAVAWASPEVPAVPPVILAARQAPRSPTNSPDSLPEHNEYRVGYPPNPFPP
jgi:hypothetical protein